MVEISLLIIGFVLGVLVGQNSNDSTGSGHAWQGNARRPWGRRVAA